MSFSRRDFLGAGALLGAGLLANGCKAPKAAGTAGAPMMDFACAPIPRIRVGVIGLGSRGGWAVNRLSMVPGVVVTAVCDIDLERVARKVDWGRRERKLEIRGFGGKAESWKELCAWDGIDVVYNATPWQLHAEIGLFALDCGKHVFIEVPAALRIDDCWALVEKAEKTRLHCMQLENACYHELSLTGLMMIRAGLFGELTHGQAGYIHDLTAYNWTGYWQHWRLEWNRRHCGDQYPTHDLGPLAKAFDITRGDTFDYLVSVDSPQASFELWAQEHFPEDDPRRNVKIAMADMTNTIIKTARGKTILLQHDVSTPRPRRGRFLIQGAGGYFDADLPQVCYRDFNHKGSAHHKPLPDAELRAELEKFAHPFWQDAGKLAKLAGGHGGMDYMMDLRWAYCLQNGLPLDQDVYELATWCATCELSERSVRAGSAPQTYPDFTRGAWKTAEPRPIEGFDPAKIDLDGKGVRKDATEMKT